MKIKKGGDDWLFSQPTTFFCAQFSVDEITTTRKCSKARGVSKTRPKSKSFD